MFDGLLKGGALQTDYRCPVTIPDGARRLLPLGEMIGQQAGNRIGLGGIGMLESLADAAMQIDLPPPAYPVANQLLQKRMLKLITATHRAIGPWHDGDFGDKTPHARDAFAPAFHLVDRLLQTQRYRSGAKMFANDATHFKNLLVFDRKRLELILDEMPHFRGDGCRPIGLPQPPLLAMPLDHPLLDEMAAKPHQIQRMAFGAPREPTAKVSCHRPAKSGRGVVAHATLGQGC